MGKRSLWIGVILMVAFVACKKTNPPPNTGVPECDEYIVKYEACINNMGAIARSAAESALKTQREAFTKAASTPEAKKALATQCKASMDAIKSTCP